MEFQPWMMFPFLAAMWGIAFAIRANGISQQQHGNPYGYGNPVENIREVEVVDPYEGVPAFQDQQRGFELNNDGYEGLDSSGDKTTALALLEASAGLGIPQALATLTWFHILKGDCPEAQRVFERYWPKCKDFEYLGVNGQLIGGDASREARNAVANCASNGGLIYECLRQTQKRDELWQSALSDGNVEARAYLLFSEGSCSISGGLSQAETIELLSICSKAISEAKIGSFAYRWFTDIQSALAK